MHFEDLAAVEALSPEEWLKRKARVVVDEELARATMFGGEQGVPVLVEDAKTETNLEDRKPLLHKTGESFAHPRSKSKASKKPMSDDVFLTLARESVVTNYNEHRKPERSSRLDVQGVQVVSFTKLLGHMKALLCAPKITGIIWEVTFNSFRNELYIDIYTKLNNVKIALGEDSIR